MAKELRIGLVGYGFMGRTHTNGYKRVNDFSRNWNTVPFCRLFAGELNRRRKNLQNSGSSSHMKPNGKN